MNKLHLSPPMINPTVPLIEDTLISLELPNGQFVQIDTRMDANGDYKIELLDKTGEFVAGLQSAAEETCTQD